MAQRVQVLLVCDLHDDEVAGDETVAFSLDGAAYEIDLCAAHADELRDVIAPYIGAARRAGGRAGGSRRGRGRASSGGGGSRGSSADVREWARSQGYEVSERGRIPASIQQAYNAAH